MRVLLKHGTVLKEDQLSPLHMACAKGKIQIVEAIVGTVAARYIIIVHVCDQYSQSLLHFSASAVNGDCISDSYHYLHLTTKMDNCGDHFRSYLAYRPVRHSSMT